MEAIDYQEIRVTLSAATFSRLERASAFNKRRAADQAVEMIRVALLAMYPPRTPDEWNDKTRYQGVTRHILLTSYDLVCYSLRRSTGRQHDRGKQTEQPTQITLKVPMGLVKWIQKLAHDRAITVPEATIFAIEYGHQVLDSQPKGAESPRKVWRDIIQAMWKRARD
jgi:hypothetical protein